MGILPHQSSEVVVRRDPKILNRIDRVIRVCEAKGVAFGMPISNPDWYQEGIRFLLVSSDIDLSVTGGGKIVASFKDVPGESNLS